MKANQLVYLADVIELMLDAVCVVDKQGRLVFANSAFNDIFGYDPQHVLGQKVIDFVHPDDREQTIATVQSIIMGERKPHYENRWIKKDGSVVYILWSARWSEEHQVRIAVAHDITERKLMEVRLLHMAGHDELTNLPNRSLLLDRLNTSLVRAERDHTNLTLLFIDIDGFKEVNDKYGHAAGDRVLQNIAARLVHAVRKSDTVGRLGGDEFLVILHGITVKADVISLVETIRQQLCLPLTYQQHNLEFSASIGVVQYPDQQEDAEQLIKFADRAMYQAKLLGGNQAIIYDEGLI
ncbi:diguanylate cyclase domain-containing protein [Pseudoalteromonas mariniglutinosa]|uniref:diguanylate cyclase domain-containing protein n=1 Tax=Pseudoalteromonas mariniglutinosa TaxID=206042 RepID=UPI00384F90DE